jgi:hypothetical protein
MVVVKDAWLLTWAWECWICVDAFDAVLILVGEAVVAAHRMPYFRTPALEVHCRCSCHKKYDELPHFIFLPASVINFLSFEKF